MFHLGLWAILAVFMGLAFVVLATIVCTIAWCTGHFMRDLALGAKAVIWCPVYQQMLRVKATPRRFVEQPFTAVRRCEHWGKGAVQCEQRCVHEPVPYVA